MGGGRGWGEGVGMGFSLGEDCLGCKKFWFGATLNFIGGGAELALAGYFVFLFWGLTFLVGPVSLASP